MSRQENISPQYISTDVAVLFDGQGIFGPGMGETVYKKFAASREVFDSASEAVGVNLARVCFGDLSYLQSDTRIVQPSIVTVDLAEYAAWREVNESDASVATGLSLGMYAAMGAAGVFKNYADAVNATAIRARILHGITEKNPGKMAGAVGLAHDVLDPIAKKAGAAIAVLRDKARDSFVVTGDDDSMEQVEKEAKINGLKRWVPLSISGAFHHPINESAQTPFANELSKFNLANPQIHLLGNHGIYLQSAKEAFSHAVDQLVEPSDWDEVTRVLATHGIARVIELGPDLKRGLAQQMRKNYNAQTIDFPPAL